MIELNGCLAEVEGLNMAVADILGTLQPMKYRETRIRGSARLRVLTVIGVVALIIGVVMGVRWIWPASVSGATPEDRVASIGRLADEKPRGAADAIADEAGHPDPRVRRAVMTCLGNFLRPEDRRLIEAGLEDDDDTVRAAAAATFGLYGGREAAGQLARLLAETESPEVALGAVRGLGRVLEERHLEPEAVVALVDAMEAPWPRVRMRAFRTVIGQAGLDMHNPPNPRNDAAWGGLVTKVRRFPWVRAAYEGRTWRKQRERK
jgi:hypothetical protein